MPPNENTSCTSKTITRLVNGQPITMEVKIHPSTHKKIIVINYPGVGGDIDGYAGKYAKMAGLVSEKIGTTLRISGAEEIRGEQYELGVAKKLEATVEEALQNSEELAGCSPDNLEIYLMGFSAGASGAAAVCNKYPQVKKILLMAPSGDAGRVACEESLAGYAGELYALVGENDEIVRSAAANIFAQMALSASRVRDLVIPNCTHQFKGSINGQIMSAAPIWAFLKNGEGSIDPNDGIILY